MTLPLSGTPVELRWNDYSASIATIGATLRRLRHAGRDLIVPFDADEVRPHFRGATLAPWPNRVVNGRYTVDGVEQLLALSEPKRGHALHGLATWLDFQVAEQHLNRVRLVGVIPAQVGYPFRLELTVTFELDDDGLHTNVSALNTGNGTAPFGTAPHPYLVAGEGRVDEWTLSLPAARVLTVTADRLIPSGLANVVDAASGAFDFHTPRVIGDTMIDHAFTALDRDAAGIAEVRLTAASGTGVVMRWDTSCPWVQIHTADQPDPAIDRLGLAVEPMTCPPDAFNTGEDLLLIDRGETVSAGWTIAAL